jgi:hypothetical protein
MLMLVPQGLTAYQTDWSIAAVTLRVKNLDAQTSEEPLSVTLPVASLEGQPGKPFYSVPGSSTLGSPITSRQPHWSVYYHLTEFGTEHDYKVKGRKYSLICTPLAIVVDDLGMLGKNFDCRDTLKRLHK